MLTIKRINQLSFCLVVLLVTLLIPSNVFAQAGTTVLVSPASSTATTCAPWEIAINVADVVDLTAYHLEISFDPGYLDIVEVRNGDFLDEGLYEVTNSFDNIAGTISFGMAQQNHLADPIEPKSGSGTLIIIKVQATGENQTVDFTIDDTNSLLVNWPDVQEIPFTATNGSVTTRTCAPTNIALSNHSLAENLPAMTEIGTLSTTDPDTGDTFVYTLENDAMYSDNLFFQISGDKLYSSVVFNYEVKSNFSIMVRSTDQGGSYFEKVFFV